MPGRLGEGAWKDANGHPSDREDRVFALRNTLMERSRPEVPFMVFIDASRKAALVAPMGERVVIKVEVAVAEADPRGAPAEGRAES